MGSTHCAHTGAVLIASPVRLGPSSLRKLTHRNHRITAYHCCLLCLAASTTTGNNTFDILAKRYRVPGIPPTMKTSILLRTAAAVAATALLIASVRGDAGVQDGGGSGGGGDSFWDNVPNVITSCDFGGAKEVGIGGIFTFLGRINCTTPTVRRCSVCVCVCGGPINCTTSRTVEFWTHAIKMEACTYTAVQYLE